MGRPAPNKKNNPENLATSVSVPRIPVWKTPRIDFTSGIPTSSGDRCYPFRELDGYQRDTYCRKMYRITP